MSNNKNKMKDFYQCWWFLYNHSLFKDDNDDSRFNELLDVTVVKVNPKNNKIEYDNEKQYLNTKVQVWIEIGAYSKKGTIHDVALDCGGKTYEKAIVKLANLVYKNYGVCYFR